MSWHLSVKVLNVLKIVWTILVLLTTPIWIEELLLSLSYAESWDFNEDNTNVYQDLNMLNGR